ncbi:MAG TPA: PDR/VanB family oxidoreductase [Stackebrandtia sp.]|jgi:ferredoxin-NADP reductase|uniref:PDR/VanB family oxidoreductase n=1 Tax=Stackebrandtia sp. TaxID=2023065 RepID=UPI002D2B3A78|nr:PDR/VanB family oxidoreductase [Stackebrandtia sp.]HZE40660.1 PDR/VanB family oxidoreductase [Stackebrandtia sp.]
MITRTPPPPDLYGRRRPDRFLRATSALMYGLQWVSRVFGGDIAEAPRSDALRRLRVDEVTVPADDVAGLRLVADGGGALPAWRPGAHLDVRLPSGRWRQYSLCGDVEETHAYRVAVRRIGAGSGEMHRLRPGDTVATRGPRNAFPLVADVPVLFLAGGIGITPIAAMARHCERLGADWRLIYTGRTPASMPFASELKALNPSRVVLRSDDADGVPDARELLASAAQGGAVYCCGPPPMLEAVLRAFDDCAAARLHFERFSPPPIVDGRELEVTLARGQTVLRVPADRTVLDVIASHRPETAYSCRQGFCGTCRVRVLSGRVRHHDSRLTRDERDRGDMLICVSRADGPLVLDL